LRAVLLESDWSVCFLATGSIPQAGSVLFAMASGFPEVDDNAIQELIISSENENTIRSTNYWLSVFRKWALIREVKQDLEDYECEALDKTKYAVTMAMSTS